MVSASDVTRMPDGVLRLTLLGTGPQRGVGNGLDNVMWPGNGVGHDTLLGMAGNDTLWGGYRDDSLSGGIGADSLVGWAGDDTIQGGPGADTMAGGDGNDTYLVSGSDDLIVEADGGGVDSVITSNWFFQLPAGVENLVLTRPGGAVGFGNRRDNVLTGGAGADTLRGGGGHDVLIGGDGNDSYWVGTPGESIVETPAGGNDTVTTSLAFYQIGANIEDLVLVNAAGATGWGNSGDNHIIGATGNDALRGGAGNDILRGGDGADTLYGGTGSDSIDGGAGNDTLDGGAGADVLAGSGGANKFDFANGQAWGDTILDFIPGVDRIVFHGFGVASNGATFANIGGSSWQITPVGGGPASIVHLANGAVPFVGDVRFV